MTLTSINEKDSKKREPNASSPEERFETLGILNKE
jgi:DNA repair photolyase